MLTHGQTQQPAFFLFSQIHTSGVKIISTHGQRL